MKYGKLTLVTENHSKDKDGRILSLFACECGGEKIIKKHQVFLGKQKSCGCGLAEIPDKGTIFGMLTVEGRAQEGGRTLIACKCACGEHKNVEYFNLKIGHTSSCGCKNSGKYDIPERGVLSKMKERCNKESNQDYPNYGGRGIKVCERWSDENLGLINFLSDMGRRPTDKHSIDRIDVNGNYEPSNCRWADHIQQANNKTNTVYIFDEDVKKPFGIFCREKGLNYKRYHRYYKRKNLLIYD